MSNQVNGGSICDDCEMKDDCTLESKGTMGRGPVFPPKAFVGEGLIMSLGMVPSLSDVMAGAYQVKPDKDRDPAKREAIDAQRMVDAVAISPDVVGDFVEVGDKARQLGRPFTPNKYQSKPIVGLMNLDHPMSIEVGGHLHGAAYGHPNFPNGSPVRTSSIVGLKIKGRMAEVETRNTLYHVPLAA